MNILLLCLSFVICVSLIGAAHYFRSKERFCEAKETDKKWLLFWWPLAQNINEFAKRSLGMECAKEKIKNYQLLHIGTEKKDLEQQYSCEKISVFLMIFFLVFLLVFLSILFENRTGNLKQQYYLQRQEPGQGNRQVNLEIKHSGEKKEIKIDIPERQYTREELEAEIIKAKEYIGKNYLGENKDAEHIKRPLRFINTIPDSEIQVKWTADNNGYINADGSLSEEDRTECVDAEIEAKILYQGKEVDALKINCILYPQEYTKEEFFWKNWEEESSRLSEDTKEKKVLELPRNIIGEEVRYQEKMPAAWPKILFVGLFVCVLFPFVLDYQIEQGIKKREEQMHREYPELIDRFVLLIGAGMTIRGAWERIATDYRKRHEKREISSHYLYEEMLYAMSELENGQSEAKVYEEFGRRSGMICYMKFGTLLAQSLRKGTDDFLQRMNLEAEDALRERKEQVKKAGEEAGAKLLLPMFLMLIEVFAIILMAAFQQL